MKPIYHRILLKLSGESLAAEQSSGIDPQRVADYTMPPRSRKSWTLAYR